MTNSCKKFTKKIKFYYKFSLLNKKLVNNVDNIKIYIYDGCVFDDFHCTRRKGKIFIEQTINAALNETKSTINVIFPEGVITYVLFHVTNDGKGIQNTTPIGPLIYGTKRFLFWNSSKYFSRTNNYPDDNTRSVTIYKNNDFI
jgi:hypothetical protein